MTDDRILVTGATGYVGGRLVPRLLDRGYRIRAVSRTLEKLKARNWADHPRAELMQIDALDAASVQRACQDCRAAYYLIHSMSTGTSDFEQADRTAARNMARAAADANMDQIIYLGGLGSQREDLSKHLRSRAEVADVLRSGSVPVTVLRASIIIGSGSASFEILRYLVERLPVMITPRWVRTRTQPIAIENVLTYLVGCLEAEETEGDTFDIGGPDVLTFERLMQMYAETAGLPRRYILQVPVLTPRLSSYWVHLVTPVPAALARPLIEGLRHPTVCTENRIQDILPQTLLDCETAMEEALQEWEKANVATHWSDAGTLPPAAWADPSEPEWVGGTVYEDHRRVVLEATPGEVWDVVTRIGGKTGWYFADWLWKLRGWIDRLVGGVGLRRGRRDPETIHVGDALDFWRVVKTDPPRRLVLAAEMKLPGTAVLEFEVKPREEGLVECHQRAVFRPRGLAGILYWKGVSPFHNLVFNGMLRGIARATGCPVRESPQLVPGPRRA